MKHNLQKKIISSILGVSLPFFGSGCIEFTLAKYRADPYQKYLHPDNPVDKYALLVYSTSECNTKYNKNVEPIDENCDTLSLFRIYESLIKNKFKDENIFVLYSSRNRTPNFDVGNQDIAKRIKEKQFNNTYDNTASEKNIEALLDKLKSKADFNDKVVFHLLGHGDFLGNIYLDTWDIILPFEFQKYVDGWRSDSNWFMIMNCYGGTTFDLTDVDNVCLYSATESNKLNWTDKDWCSGFEFIEAKSDQKNDANNDGIVDYKEAAKAVDKKAKEYWVTFLRDFVANEYEGGLGYEQADEISIQPKVKAGKNFKKTNLR